MSAAIHPSAVVEDGARIGAGVRIGPFCHVGPEVALGEGCELVSHVVLAGKTTVGPRTRIFPFASLGHQPQDLKFKGEPSTLRIGADCLIREGVTMNPGTEGGGLETVVGDRCAFLANSHVGHDCRVGDGVIFSNNVMLAGHCTVGNYALVSERPYKRAWPLEKAREHLIAQKGSHFDPACVDAFLSRWDDVVVLLEDRPTTSCAA